MTTTLELINAIASGNSVATENAFNAAIAEKISGKLDDMRLSVAQSMFKPMVEEEVEFTTEEWEALSEEEQAEFDNVIVEGSNATDSGLQTRMNKNFTKSVATRYDGTRKQEAQGKKGLVKTAKIIKSRGGDAKASKQAASDKNDYENEM